MDLIFLKVDLSLQDSGPFFGEGGSSEPTESPLATGLSPEALAYECTTTVHRCAIFNLHGQ